MKKVLFLSAFLLTFLMTLSSSAEVVEYYWDGHVDQATASVKTIDGGCVVMAHIGGVPTALKFDSSGNFVSETPIPIPA